ncbi:MAG: alpha/beta fold hydrolase [Caldilineaceae bacterium]|nr:alpha/beta fold hydrolase [Caldilineaceae bacterium]
MIISDPARPVVLVPGYRDNRHKLAALAVYLRRLGFDPRLFSPQPSDGSAGINELAARLAAQIDAELGPDQPFDYFGFSMGGLIGRYYLQRLDGVRRIRRFVTLATPHLGSWSAYGVRRTPAIEQMRPNSDFLQALNNDPAALDQVQFAALWTPFDLSVTPAHHAYLPDRPARRLLSPFHGLLVYDPTVQRAIARVLAAPTEEPLR